MRIDTFLSSPRIGFQDEAAEFDFFPMTFTLPSEGQMFLRAFHESGGVWIMKPIGRAQGKGIFLVNKASQIESWLRHDTVAFSPRVIDASHHASIGFICVSNLSYDAWPISHVCLLRLSVAGTWEGEG
eukprot:7874189-Pyramimonas_sp.AAC.1